MVRSALHNAHADKPDGPRPCVFKSAVISGIDPVASVPCITVSFNLPERVQGLRTVKDKVWSLAPPFDTLPVHNRPEFHVLTVAANKLPSG